MPARRRSDAWQQHASILRRSEALKVDCEFHEHSSYVGILSVHIEIPRRSPEENASSVRTT